MIRLATETELKDRLAQPDMADLVADDFDPTGYIALTDGRNILLATAWARGSFEIHWLFTDKGRVAINAALDFLRYLYESHDTRVVVGQTPVRKRAARWFSRQIGAQSDGVVQTKYGEVELFSITRQQFEARNGLSKR